MMKRILLLFLGFYSLNLYSQNHNGKLLPNEIKSNENIEQRRPDFQIWRSYAEVFIKVWNPGRFKISLGGQSIESNTGMFRFFDLTEGSQTLSIYESNRLLYRTRIFAERNQRLILEFDYYQGLFLTEQLPLNQSQDYGFFYEKPTMTDLEFSNFERFFTQRGFDKERIDSFIIQTKSNTFTTAQIIKLLQLMSFDKYKTELAKTAYPHCIDPQNYYQIVDAMPFKSSKEELLNFLRRQ